ncbi:glutaminyl-peptide cyclotransferase [Psychroserpens algicola]|uniref:Glutaminyl-peptide cyclotransferase n=1 Tax=Psychroserpens algicola TaxID=1719034 RepID=A0ABT0H9U3_9FLAO|nr:glutaminyl-peptide cyclotransferase [Psychroserpens algicola]MCK8481161.1 glutaminyl-peptide cyclotransferase [Psychroserpens algicola]
MHTIKALILTLLGFSIISCGNDAKEKTNLSITTNTKTNVFALGETAKLSIENPKGLDISSVTYKMNGEVIDETLQLDDEKLGIHNISATVKFGESSEDITTKITILNNEVPKIYGYKIINTYPHDITSYTQGLEFYKGELYESTGQYGESKLRKVDYKSGEVLQNINLSRQYFAEGLTIFNDRIYQLTWQENIGFIYDVNTFEKTSSFKYGKSKEGWGICNDGKHIYKSDGTEKIWLLNPETLAEESKLQAYTNKGKIIELNELEYINGKIYANRYQKNGVAIINPKNGAIEGVIDFSPLHKLVTQHQGLDVINGIAYNPDTKTIFVTGKRWDKLFEVEVFEK